MTQVGRIYKRSQEEVGELIEDCMRDMLIVEEIPLILYTSGRGIRIASRLAEAKGIYDSYLIGEKPKTMCKKKTPKIHIPKRTQLLADRKLMEFFKRSVRRRPPKFY